VSLQVSNRATRIYFDVLSLTAEAEGRRLLSYQWQGIQRMFGMTIFT